MSSATVESATRADASNTTTKRPLNYEDLKDVRSEYHFPMPQFLTNIALKSIHDKRDIIMVHLIFNVAVIVLPFAALLYALESVPIWLGCAYIVTVYVLFIQRFVLTLHYSSHRPFSPKASLLEYFVVYILCPFFGIPPGSYYLHHCVMHHVENNVFPYDVSSTMTYQRDNVVHFLRYWMRYTFAIWFQLPYYAFQRKRWELLFSCINAEVVYLGLIYWLWHHHTQACIYIFIVPFFITSFLLMIGNWGQHVFVDPDRYDNSYALTYNLINSPMNAVTYNDGYHILHHVNSRVHWSELPRYFNKSLDRLKKEDALTFEKLDFFMVAIYCFMQKFDTLYEHYVHLEEDVSKRRSKEEVIAMLKRRLEPIQPREKTATK